jgi:hypothetical protein
MSITDLSKIGEWLKKNQGDIAIVIGFILVALIAFGAGRLSTPEIVRNPIVIEQPSASSSVNLLGNVSQPIIGTAGESAQNLASEKGLFVASKNSNKYHWPWCAAAKQIKPENEIWFKSEAQAQAAGYSPSACIQSQAPAGYKP